MKGRITIALEHLRIYAYHGVMEQERTVGNEFIADLSLDIDATEGMRRDQLDGTISYADIYAVIAAQMQTPSRTLEYAAIRIAEALQSDFPQIKSGSVKITKVTPPIPGICGSASVTYTF